MKTWFATDAGLKMMSLILATVVWLFVKAVTSDTRLVESVELQVVPKAGMTAAYRSISKVNVTVRGTTEDLRQASRNELFAIVDLTQVSKPGRTEAAITTKSIRHPPRVRVVAVEPTNVVVRLEQAME